jgi:hypothetical protein
MQEIIEEQDRTIQSLLNTIKFRDQLIDFLTGEIEGLEGKLYQCENLLRELREERNFYNSLLFGGGSK